MPNLSVFLRSIMKRNLLLFAFILMGITTYCQESMNKGFVQWTQEESLSMGDDVGGLLKFTAHYECKWVCNSLMGEPVYNVSIAVNIPNGLSIDSFGSGEYGNIPKDIQQSLSIVDINFTAYASPFGLEAKGAKAINWDAGSPGPICFDGKGYSYHSEKMPKKYFSYNVSGSPSWSKLFNSTVSNNKALVKYGFEFKIPQVDVTWDFNAIRDWAKSRKVASKNSMYISDLYQKAKQAYQQEDNYSKALRYCNEILKYDPYHNGAKKIKEGAKYQIDFQHKLAEAELKAKQQRAEWENQNAQYETHEQKMAKHQKDLEDNLEVLGTEIADALEYDVAYDFQVLNVMKDLREDQNMLELSYNSLCLSKEGAGLSYGFGVGYWESLEDYSVRVTESSYYSYGNEKVYDYTESPSAIYAKLSFGAGVGGKRLSWNIVKADFRIGAMSFENVSDYAMLMSISGATEISFIWKRLALTAGYSLPFYNEAWLPDGMEQKVDDDDDYTWNDEYEDSFKLPKTGTLFFGIGINVGK